MRTLFPFADVSSRVCNLMPTVLVLSALLLCATPVRCDPQPSPDVEVEAKAILTKAGRLTGLVVHVGCGNGRLTAALAKDGRLVHGLDRDRKNVADARRTVHSQGLYGTVTVDHFNGRHLPYVDNLVNLLIASDLGSISQDEVMRVLAPGGVACVKRDGAWDRAVKPRPEEVDEWTHFLHDSNNNAVSRDRLAGAPRRLQWLADPVWSRNHHKLASISSVVSAGGRIFYIVDEATGADMRISGRWSLTARDAYNGLLLWKRDYPKWVSQLHRFRSGPVQLQRLLVATDERVYATLGANRPVSELDAATGQTLRTYSQTEGAEEFVVRDGILYVVTGTPVAEHTLVGPSAGRKGDKAKRQVPEKAILAVRCTDGETLWRWSSGTDEPLPSTLAADGRRVVFAGPQRVLCLDAQTGKQRWAADVPYTHTKPGQKLAYGAELSRIPVFMSPTGSAWTARTLGWSVGTLVLGEDVVLWAGTHELRALDVSDGRVLWSTPCRAGYCRSPVDVFLIGEQVWVGPDFVAARDARTGEVTRENTVFENLWTAGHHHRCYRNKATSRFIYTSSRGIELMDLLGDNHSRNNWVRGVCQYGILPCNGLLYAPPHACGCYIEAMMRGFMAFSTDEAGTDMPVAKARLTEGAASEKAPGAEPVDAADWPTYRGNAARSGATSMSLPGKLVPVWEAVVGGTLTQPVLSGDVLVVSSIDRYEVHALNRRSGKVLWKHLAGGRVDSAPTLHAGKVYFGAADGTVTCLRASDGGLVWHYLVAPSRRRLAARGRLESVWPVRGSVLVRNGLVYAAAGRSSYLDGGITLVALDPESGEVVHENTFASVHPDFAETMKGKDEKEKQYPYRHVARQYATDWKTYTDPDRSDSFAMDGGVCDILVGSGDSIYMKQLCFDPSLQRRDTTQRHLYATSVLLDGSEQHRTHYVLGTGNFTEAMIGYSWVAEAHKAMAGQFIDAPYGLLLAFGDTTAWGVWRQRGGTYTLFSEALRTHPPSGETRRDMQWHKKGMKMRDWNWQAKVVFRPRALLRAGDTVVLGGSRAANPADPLQMYAAQTGGQLCLYSARDGSERSRIELKASPVWDGVAAAHGHLYVVMTDGRIACLKAE